MYNYHSFFFHLAVYFNWNRVYALTINLISKLKESSPLTFIIIQDLLDFYLSPLHFSIVFLFIIALILNHFPGTFHLFVRPYDKRIEGTNIIVKCVAVNEIIPIGFRFIACMKFQFYHTDNDEESSSVCF
jgi:hypothetical protein